MLCRILNVLKNHFPALKPSEYADLSDELYKFNVNSTLELTYELHEEFGTEYTIEDGIIHLVNY